MNNPNRLPWRYVKQVGDSRFNGTVAYSIVNCDGGLIADCFYEDRAKFLVESVNNIEQLQKDLHEAKKEVNNLLPYARRLPCT